MNKKSIILKWALALVMPALVATTLAGCGNDEDPFYDIAVAEVMDKGGNSGGGGGGGETPGGGGSTVSEVLKALEANMVSVPAGTFSMGAPSSDNDAADNEMPQHQVTLAAYKICKYEVTQEVWIAVMGSNPSSVNGNKLPVTDITYDDCLAFITKLNAMTRLNYRLPTEAEWEYAAIGGVAQAVYKYAGGNTLRDVCWAASNSENKTHEVGGKQANQLGLYDMSGNVAEWCLDWYGVYSSEAQTNPTGPTTGSRRVLRGGSRMDQASGVRVTSRSYAVPTTKNNYTGLRLVL